MGFRRPFPSTAAGRPGGGAWATVFLAVLLAVAAAPLSAARLELRGTAVDESGAPFAGARVELQAIAPRHEIGGRIVAGILAAEATGAVQTSGDGGYVLTVPEPGMWQVEISAPGKIPLRRRMTPLTEDRELPPAVLAADGGAWISVADAAGAPVAGALVWARPVEDSDERRRRPRPEWQPRGRFARTDEAGTAYLSRQRGVALEVWAFAPGFMPSASVAVAGDRGRVALERGRPIEMRFLTAAGEPAAQAIVGVGQLQWASAKTDHLGRTRIFLLPGEPLPFSLLLPSGQRESGTLEAAEEDFDQEAGEVEEMTLPPPRVLSGRVVDADTRDPLPEAWVWSASDPGRVERVDRAGGYRLLESTSGYWQIGAAAPSYRPAFERKRSDGDDRGPTLALRRSATIAGRVVDEAGEGIGGAHIVAVASGEDPAWSETTRKVTSGADGGFRLDGLMAEASYEASARAPGFAPLHTAFRARPGVALEIVLEAGRAVVGRVVSPGGEPIAGARLIAAPPLDLAGPPRRGMHSSDMIAAESAADGTFGLEGLPSDRLTLAVRKKGFAPREVPLLDHASSAAGTGPLDLGDVVLEPGARVHGIVRARDREPVAGAGVQVVGAGMSASFWIGRTPADDPQPMTTDAEGRFEVEGLVAGERLSLMFDHPDYLRRNVDGLVAGDEEPVEVVLERAARVRGRVEDEARRPAPGTTVRAHPIESRDGGLTTAYGDAMRRDVAVVDYEGRFALERVAPGVVEIEASGGDGYVSAGAIELEIAPGEVREGIVLRVRRGLTLEGTVRDTARRPIVGAFVQISEIVGSGSFFREHGIATAQTDGEGRYRLEGLDPAVGTVRMGVHHPEFLEHSRELAPGTAVSPLDVVLERGYPVSGVVLTASGNPAAGASVGLDGGGGVYFVGSRTSISDPQGRFEISGVGPGTYRLFAMKEGFARSASPEPVEVVDGPVAGLVLRLSRGGTVRGQVLGLEADEMKSVEVMAGDTVGRSATGYVSADGTFTIPQVGFAEGFVTGFTEGGARQASEPFELDPEGGEAWVDLAFEERGRSTLSGIVLLDGEPWSNVQVAALGGLDSHGSGRTDGRGRFRIEGLADGIHRLVLVGGAVVAHSQTVEVLGATEVTVEINTVVVRGRVVAASGGEPIARAEVTAEGAVPDWMAPMAARVETTAAGEFHLVLPANRQVVLRATAVGLSDATLAIDTGPGPPIEGLELEMGSGTDLELDVRLASGLPPAWVSAAVVDGRGRRVAGESRQGDTVMPMRVRAVPPGDWTLRVAGEGGAMVTRPVRVPGPRVSVVLPPESRLALDLSALAGTIGNAQLRVLGPSGTPIPLAAFGQQLDSWPLYSPVSEIPSLPAGDWIVEVRDDRGQVWRQPVTTVAGATARVSFE